MSATRPVPDQPVPCRAVIFDLDDTLIDTAGQLVEGGHRQAAAAMIAAGLAVPFEELLALRLRLFAEDPRADLEARVLASLGRSDASAIAEAGRRAYHRPAVPAAGLALPGAHSMLRRLARDWPLYLVTRGEPAVQADKARKSRLLPSFDQAVYVPLAGNKSAALQHLVERMGFDPRDCVVVGDRPDSEIAAGNRLGMWTIRVRRGEFAALDAAGPDEVPHWTVSDVREVQDLLLTHFVSLGRGAPSSPREPA